MRNVSLLPPFIFLFDVSFGLQVMACPIHTTAKIKGMPHPPDRDRKRERTE